MDYQSRARKRVHAIPRGPDGSAFQKCENCGLSVAIALVDMHECAIKKNASKKLKTREREIGIVREQRFQDQPRSPFRFFMEEFMKTCKDGTEVEIDKLGIETWKNMSEEERLPFVRQAEKINSEYEKLLLKEESEIQWANDEADSAEVGKYDEKCEDYEMYSDYEGSREFGLFHSETIWSFKSSRSREELDD